MDAQCPFASRDDIWRVLEEVKELHSVQFEQADRIARLERRRDEDARVKSLWGPMSPFPTPGAGPISAGKLRSLRINPIFAHYLSFQSLFSTPLTTPSRASTRVSTTP